MKLDDVFQQDEESPTGSGLRLVAARPSCPGSWNHVLDLRCPWRCRKICQSPPRSQRKEMWPDPSPGQHDLRSCFFDCFDRRPDFRRPTSSAPFWTRLQSTARLGLRRGSGGKIPHQVRGTDEAGASFI